MRDAFISFFFTLWSDKDSEDYAEFVSLRHEKVIVSAMQDCSYVCEE